MEVHRGNGKSKLKQLMVLDLLFNTYITYNVYTPVFGN